jgi:pentatricopeptide repeat protein
LFRNPICGLVAVRPISHIFVLLPTTRRSGADPRNGVVAPDYGTAYVPNAGPAHLAPQSLDHFKRGYAERANMRDKEFYSRRHGPTGREQRKANGGNNNNRNEDRKPPPSRPMIVDGLDIYRAIDRLATLIHSQPAVFKELDQMAQETPTILGSGKTITLMISAVARRKEIGVGNAIWEVRIARKAMQCIVKHNGHLSFARCRLSIQWMDARKMEKNTFHYNAMISVTEKAQDYRRALALLNEMSKRGVEKNEVTYVSRYRTPCPCIARSHSL